MISDKLFTADKYREYHSLVRRLQDAGHKAYFVGGCVRDELLCTTPHDVDLTTSALPEQVISLFHDYTVIQTGLKHGTVTLVLKKGENCEITTFRTESDYSDNRHPDKVDFVTDVAEDLSRRDFTINAMAYNDSEGLVDLFGGVNDLSTGIIRAVGVPTRRFHEDGLRILRALRFSARLDFVIDKATAEAIKNDAYLLKNISAERLAAELNALLLYPAATSVLREYRDVFAVFIPELSVAFDYDQQNFHHKYDLYEHTLVCMDAVPNRLELKLAALFHDLGKPATLTIDEKGVGHYYGHAPVSANIADGILKRLKYSNQIRETVVALVDAHMVMPPANARAALKFLKKYGEELSFPLLDLIHADRVATGFFDLSLPDATGIELARALVTDQLALKNCFTLRSLAVNGSDLISIGVPAGKTMGALLNALLDKVVDGSLPNDRSALLSAVPDLLSTLK